MDLTRFDALLRALATGHSRRRLTEHLGGFVLGGSVALTGLVGAEAGKHKHKRKRRHKKKRRDGSTCRPICPTCQSCNAARGRCEALPDDRPAPGCAAPKLCCRGTCCDTIHACTPAGTCARCDEVCPENCGICFTLADGATYYGGA